MKRSAIAAALFALGLLVPLGAWFATGWIDVRRRQAEIAAEAQRAAARRQAEVAARLAERLLALRDAESNRPYYHYQNLFHDPAAADSGVSVGPSPLAQSPADPLIWSYFQVDAGGRLTVPTFNPDIPELNARGCDLESQKILDALATVDWSSLAERAPAVESQRQTLDNGAYLQNVAANRIYHSLKHQGQAAAAPAGQVTIVIGPMRFAVAEVRDGPRLVAVRSVETPDGSLSQGFVLSLCAMGPGAALPDDARVVASASAAAEGDAVPIPLEKGSLRLVVDPPGAAALVERKAAVSSAFLARFVPVALVAVLAGLAAAALMLQSERLARQRSRFAASAAHELRTPLAGLQLYGEMLAGDLGDPAQSKRYAQRIADEAARLGRVVGNVLGFSQLENGELRVQPSRGDLAQALAEEVDHLAKALAPLGAELALDAEEGDYQVDFDRDAIARVLHNLIDNAEKYGRNAADRRVTVALVRREGTVEIAVIDRGPGIAPALARRLFQAFSRGGGGDDPPGIGLGLSLARALVRAHGGELRHEPTEGGGATFVMTLPG